MVYIKKQSFHGNDQQLYKTLIEFGAHIGDYQSYKHFSGGIFYYVYCIRNNFLVFDLKKTVFILQRSIHFVYSLSKNFGRLLFFHSDVHIFFLKFIFFFLIKYKTLNSFVNSKIHGGILSNYRHCFLKFIKVLANLPMYIRRKRFSRIKLRFIEFNSSIRSSFFYRYLFLKLICLTHEKTQLNNNWLEEYNSIIVFWKSFLFVRSFKSIFNLPDCLISINPNNDWYITSEYSKTKKIPSISIVDTSSVYANTTFSIPSNDDSIPLSLFYISIFINVWLVAHCVKYN